MHRPQFSICFNLFGKTNLFCSIQVVKVIFTYLQNAHNKLLLFNSIFFKCSITDSITQSICNLEYKHNPTRRARKNQWKKILQPFIICVTFIFPDARKLISSSKPYLSYKSAILNMQTTMPRVL